MVKVEKVDSTHNLADVLTKNLGKTRFKFLIDRTVNFQRVEIVGEHVYFSSVDKYCTYRNLVIINLSKE